MITVLLIIGGILLECIILGVGIYLGRKYFYKPPVKLKVPEVTNIESLLSEIEKRKQSAISEIERRKHKKVVNPEMIYSSGMQKERPVKRSGGDLVPYGLNDSEREILEMFYDKD